MTFYPILSVVKLYIRIITYSQYKLKATTMKLTLIRVYVHFCNEQNRIAFYNVLMSVIIKMQSNIYSFFIIGMVINPQLYISIFHMSIAMYNIKKSVGLTTWGAQRVNGLTSTVIHIRVIYCETCDLPTGGLYQPEFCHCLALISPYLAISREFSQ